VEANIPSDQSLVATSEKDHTCNRNDNCYADNNMLEGNSREIILFPVPYVYS
jgi:hypothetical protein